MALGLGDVAHRDMGVLARSERLSGDAQLGDQARALPGMRDPQATPPRRWPSRVAGAVGSVAAGCRAWQSLHPPSAATTRARRAVRYPARSHRWRWNSGAGLRRKEHRRPEKKNELLSVLPSRVRHKTVVAAAADHFFDRRRKAHVWSLVLARGPHRAPQGQPEVSRRHRPCCCETVGTSSSTPRGPVP